MKVYKPKTNKKKPKIPPGLVITQLDIGKMSETLDRLCLKEQWRRNNSRSYIRRGQRVLMGMED